MYPNLLARKLADVLHARWCERDDYCAYHTPTWENDPSGAKAEDYAAATRAISAMGETDIEAYLRLHDVLAVVAYPPDPPEAAI